MSILTEGLAFGDLCVFDISPYYRDAQMYHAGQMHETCTNFLIDGIITFTMT